MSNDQAMFAVPKNVIEPIVEKHVTAGIVAALGEPEEIIRKAVSIAMSQKVCSNGTVSSSSYENHYDLVDLLAGNAIRTAAREQIEKWVSENTEKIRVEVEKQLAKSKVSIAKAMVDGLKDSTGRYQFSMSININPS